MFSESSIHLVDFGYATKYLDSHGKHIKEETLDRFRGNIIFASLPQLQFSATSRRDDLISLCYLLVYLINNGQLLGMDTTGELGLEDSYDMALEAKKS